MPSAENAIDEIPSEPTPPALVGVKMYDGNGRFLPLFVSIRNLNAELNILCTFLRMNLNTKEIADIMGLSVRSIESRRYRLRKKLNLSKDEDLVSNLISLKY